MGFDELSGGSIGEYRKGYLQGYLDFLGLLLNERGDGSPRSYPIT